MQFQVVDWLKERPADLLHYLEYTSTPGPDLKDVQVTKCMFEVDYKHCRKSTPLVQQVEDMDIATY